MKSNRSSGGSSDHHRRPLAKESDAEEPPSHTLWVGNLSSDTVDPDVMALFGKHGALDCNTMHTSRSYAFVFFKRVDEARSAKDALQGASIHGNPIKIKFAIPAKPGKHLWIGGISLSITKDQLEDEFLKFGKIEEYKFLRDKNVALIDYYKIENAVAAQKNMNGKRLAGEQIRVEFLRPQPLRRDFPDHHYSRDGQFSRRMGQPEPWMQGAPNRLPQSQLYGGQRSSPPSSVLWIGYPPSIQIDEQMLHNAMILFGEIEGIRSFPLGHYSLVQFRSTDEARRAKEGLQGRLFNDPRIQILFSSSEVAPPKDNSQPFPGLIGPRPDMFYNEASFAPLELFGPGCPMPPHSFSGLLPLPGPNMLMRPFAPQRIDPHQGSSELHDFGSAIQSFPDGDLGIPSIWRQHSPSAPGIPPSTAGMPPTVTPRSGGWDGFGMREPKRSRVDGSPYSDARINARRENDERIGGHFGFSHSDRGALGQSQHNVVPEPSRQQSYFDYNRHWRGIIAKGGAHVCHARCVSMGKGIDSPLPEIVNCSARTGLDVLKKYCAEATGFDFIFFLPDSEEDFAAYTEFLRYLSQKDRAGVAKLDDGTTLFLVPQSRFLTEVLGVSGPERLYGVVLHLPQISASSAGRQPQLAVPPQPSHYTNQHQVHDSHRDYDFASQNGEQTMEANYTRSFHGGAMPRVGGEKSMSAHADEPYTTQLSSQYYGSRPTSQVEVSLTPELLATLASLVPSNIPPGATGAIQMPVSSSMRSAVPSASVMQDGSMLQGWPQEHHVAVLDVSLEQQIHQPPPLGHPHNDQALISQFPTYANIPNRPDYSSQPGLGSLQAQDPSLNLPHPTTISTNPLHTNVIPSHAGHFSAPHSNQQFQLDSSASYNNNGMLQLHPVQQLEANTPSSHAQIEYLAQPSIQEQQIQAGPSGFGQGTSEGDADKNERYQSTLQLAASLLLRLQQQQQTSGQPVQGPGSQQ